MKIKRSLLIGCMVCFLVPIQSKAQQGDPGWKKNENGWYFESRLGTQLKSRWFKNMGQWYYLDGNGTMQKGWLKHNEDWFYLEPDEENFKVGIMYKGWRQIGDQWYYFEEGGIMKTGWQQTRETWYYLKSDGAMATNTIIDTYIIGAEGTIIGTEAK